MALRKRPRASSASADAKTGTSTGSGTDTRLTRSTRKGGKPTDNISLAQVSYGSVEDAGFIHIATPEDIAKGGGFLVVSAAREKAGKTRLALTMPSPIAILNCDKDLKGVADPFVKRGVKILERRFLPAPKSVGLNAKAKKDDRMKAYEQRWYDMAGAALAAAFDPAVKSVAIDTGGETHDILKIARLGRLEKVMPRDYGPVNAEFADFVLALVASGKNVLVTHKLKKEYIDDKATGGYELRGYSEMPFLAHCYVTQEREELGRGKNKRLGDFKLRIVRNAIDPEADGVELVNDEISWADIMMELYPDSEREDWT